MLSIALVHSPAAHRRNGGEAAEKRRRCSRDAVAGLQIGRVGGQDTGAVIGTFAIARTQASVSGERFRRAPQASASG
mgnify:CR=1 FL=1